MYDISNINELQFFWHMEHFLFETGIIRKYFSRMNRHVLVLKTSLKFHVKPPRTLISTQEDCFIPENSLMHYIYGLFFFYISNQMRHHCLFPVMNIKNTIKVIMYCTYS